MAPLRRPAPDPVAEPEPVPVVGTAARLADPDPEVRRRAAMALGGDPAAVPTLVARVGVEGDPTVREALCNQLARHDVPAVVDGLIGYLAGEDVALRNAVVDVLARTPTATAHRVPELLRDPDPDVRMFTVVILGSLRLPAVEGWLTEIAARDEDANVVAGALGELLSLSGDGGVPAVRAAQERFPDDPFITFLSQQVDARAGHPPDARSVTP